MASRFLTPFAGGRGLLGRGDPFLDLHREMNRLFDDAFRGLDVGQAGPGAAPMLAPRIDVHEVEYVLEISAELPGVTQNDVDLRLEGDILTLRGEKRPERRDERAYLVERSYGTFQRSIQLPFQPNPDQVQASFENGVLKITLPRQAEQEKSRRIPIGGQSGQAGQQTIEGSATQTSTRRRQSQAGPDQGQAADQASGEQNDQSAT